jgi:hypothetical protein
METEAWSHVGKDLSRNHGEVGRDLSGYVGKDLSSVVTMDSNT